MKLLILILTFVASSSAIAGVTVDEVAFGERLGGWRKKADTAADYPLSGANYRTFKPEVSPTPDGGIFISVRIDHLRGWLSSDDHATLEITVDPIGMIVAAQSKIAIQGQSVASDLIVGTNEAGKALGPTEHAVQIGSDLVANISAKMLRERIVEAGRVSFPAALRHNYNLLFQAIRVNGKPVGIGGPPVAKPVEPLEKPAAATDAGNKTAEGAKQEADADKDKGNAALEIAPYSAPASGSLPEHKE